MRIIGFKNYEEMSQASAQLMKQTILENQTVNICLASGGSPERTYQIFSEIVQDLDLTSLKITKLDEWCDVDPDSEYSCEKYLKERVILPLKLKDHQFIRFSPMSDDYVSECENVHTALMENPIDLCILGLGKNGHLGLNEPHEFLQPFAHVAELSQTTRHHAMIETNPHIIKGMTIGLAEIMASKKVLLQVSGEGKKEIFERFMSKKLDPYLPASFLWMHPNVEVYVREDQFQL